MNQYYSFSDVEDGLVEAARLWRRSPGGGRWPFASDGPWHLMTRATRAGSTIDAWRVEIDEIALKPEPATLPLTRAQIAARDAASAWLLLIGNRRGCRCRCRCRRQTLAVSRTAAFTHRDQHAGGPALLVGDGLGGEAEPTHGAVRLPKAEFTIGAVPLQRLVQQCLDLGSAVRSAVHDPAQRIACQGVGRAPQQLGGPCIGECDDAGSVDPTQTCVCSCQELVGQRHGGLHGLFTPVCALQTRAT